MWLWVIAALSKGKPYKLLYGPEIISRGFTFMKEAGELVDGAKKVVGSTLEIQLNRDQLEWGIIKTALRESTSNYFWEKTRRRPMILPVLLQY